MRSGQKPGRLRRAAGPGDDDRSPGPDERERLREGVRRLGRHVHDDVGQAPGRRLEGRSGVVGPDVDREIGPERARGLQPRSVVRPGARHQDEPRAGFLGRDEDGEPADPRPEDGDDVAVLRPRHGDAPPHARSERVEDRREDRIEPVRHLVDDRVGGRGTGASRTRPTATAACRSRCSRTCPRGRGARSAGSCPRGMRRTRGTT